METQKTPLSGHGGSHVCHKCGWTYPKPHPSAKLRRAHKRVCGTIEGYKLGSSEDKAHVNGSDGERASDDEHKTLSGKVVETAISGRSSSGVGSRSSRSTRSEDEMFADAVTDFIESPSPGEALNGLISRGNSVQNVSVNVSHGTKTAIENAVADNSSTSNPFVENNHLQSYQKVEADGDKVEPKILFQDNTFTPADDSALSSTSLEIKSDVAADEQTLPESSVIASPSEVGVANDKECQMHEGLSAQAAEDELAGSKYVSEDFKTSASIAGMLKPTDKGSDEKIELSNEIDFVMDFPASVHSAQVFDGANTSPRKSIDMNEELDLKIGENENLDHTALPNSLALQGHSEIVAENLDNTSREIDTAAAPNCSLVVEVRENSKDCVVGESDFTFDFSKPGENSGSCSGGKILERYHTAMDLDLDAAQTKSLVKEILGEEPDEVSDFKAFNADNSNIWGGLEMVEDFESETREEEEFKSTEAQNIVVSLEDAFPKSPVVVGDNYQEMCSEGGGDPSDSVVEGEHPVVHEDDGKEVDVQQLAGASTMAAEAAVDGVPGPAIELINGSDTATPASLDETLASVTATSSSLEASREPETACLEPMAIESDQCPGTKPLDKVLESFAIAEEPPASYAAAAETSQAFTTEESKIEKDSYLESTTSAKPDVESTKKEGVCEAETPSDKLESYAISGGPSYPHPTAVNTSQTFAEAESTMLEQLDVERDQYSECEQETYHKGLSEIQTSPDKLQQSPCISEELHASDSTATNASRVPPEAQTEKSDMNADEMSQCFEIKSSAEPKTDIAVAESASKIQTSLDQEKSSVISERAHASDASATDTSKVSPKEECENLELDAVENSLISGSETLAEPQADFALTESISEIQSSPEKQEWDNALQSSSSVSDVHKEPLGGKGSVEIVSDWSSGKQHTPLKTLLVEATAKSREGSPLHNRSIPVTQTEAIPMTKNGYSIESEDMALSARDSKARSMKEEMGKEWNSPARYPVNIKTEKKRSKNKPYWVPFFCCSSVNAN